MTLRTNPLLKVFGIFADRLVESSRIKKALEGVYTSILPKGSSPFIYLRFVSLTALARNACTRILTLLDESLSIDPRSVDVNVHPTKREVHFLNEEEIIERISDAIQGTLVEKNHSRTFEYQVSFSMRLL